MDIKCKKHSPTVKGYSKDYECSGQISLNDFLEPTEQAELAGSLKDCEACAFYKPFNEHGTLTGGKEVHWRCLFDNRLRHERTEPWDCKGKDWLPGRKALKGCCAACEYSNCFEYQGKQDDPEEEPNIYCTHIDGSLNRRCVYPEHIQKGFGVGRWSRQHEYDTCDRYEEEKRRW